MSIARLHEALAFRRTNTFHTAARELSLVGHIKQPIFEAGGTQIGDQDFATGVTLGRSVPAGIHDIDLVGGNLLPLAIFGEDDSAN